VIASKNERFYTRPTEWGVKLTIFVGWHFADSTTFVNWHASSGEQVPTIKSD